MRDAISNKKIMSYKLMSKVPGGERQLDACKPEEYKTPQHNHSRPEAETFDQEEAKGSGNRTNPYLVTNLEVSS